MNKKIKFAKLMTNQVFFLTILIIILNLYIIKVPNIQLLLYIHLILLSSHKYWFPINTTEECFSLLFNIWKLEYKNKKIYRKGKYDHSTYSGCCYRCRSRICVVQACGMFQWSLSHHEQSRYQYNVWSTDRCACFRCFYTIRIQHKN